MDQLHAILHKASHEVNLDPHLKGGFRRTLEVMVDEPVAAPARVFRMPRSLAWALGAVIISVSGASVTLASTRAIPGDPLYPAKVYGVEPIERALAFSADAKADVAADHLERRFREAAELSASGKLESHDEELAMLAERDVRLVDSDEHPAARARFEAMAAAYAPVLRARAQMSLSFARAVRLGDAEGDREPDDLAVAVTREQLTRAKASRDAAATFAATHARTSARLKESDRLSAAAEVELGKGSVDAALELSGAAAKVAGEAQLFAAFGSTATAGSASSTASTSSSTASTTGSVQGASTTASGAVQASTTPASSPSSVIRRLFGH